MRPEGGRFEPTREVDEIAWLTLRTAERRLSYERDRELLRSLGRCTRP
jgi:hypothetical protein